MIRKILVLLLFSTNIWAINCKEITVPFESQLGGNIYSQNFVWRQGYIYIEDPIKKTSTKVSSEKSNIMRTNINVRSFGNEGFRINGELFKKVSYKINHTVNVFIRNQDNINFIQIDSRKLPDMRKFGRVILIINIAFDPKSCQSEVLIDHS